jgi:hypothetical protein
MRFLLHYALITKDRIRALKRKIIHKNVLITTKFCFKHRKYVWRDNFANKLTWLAIRSVVFLPKLYFVT